MFIVIDQLFREYLRLIARNAKDPRLLEIERQLQKNYYYSIIVPDEQMVEVDYVPGKKGYHRFTVAILLLDARGEVVAERENYTIKIPVEYGDLDDESENGNIDITNHGFDEYDLEWLGAKKIAVSPHSSMIQYLTEYDINIPIDASKNSPTDPSKKKKNQEHFDTYG